MSLLFYVACLWCGFSRPNVTRLAGQDEEEKQKIQNDLRILTERCASQYKCER